MQRAMAGGHGSIHRGQHVTGVLLLMLGKTMTASVVPVLSIYQSLQMEVVFREHPRHCLEGDQAVRGRWESAPWTRTSNEIQSFIGVRGMAISDLDGTFNAIRSRRMAHRGQWQILWPISFFSTREGNLGRATSSRHARLAIRHDRLGTGGRLARRVCCRASNTAPGKAHSA